MDCIYIESEIIDHPRCKRILSRYSHARLIEIDRYGEVFNRKQQNFRLQKSKPALILARKHDKHVLPTPKGYELGVDRSFYFSHMLNCIYDCRYCFLQGMYRSANYLLFINYEDFGAAILQQARATSEQTFFFSGYDCDSLALEPVSEFVDYIIPLFAATPKAWLELRTKSTQIRSLMMLDPIPNCVVAFSLSPAPVAKHLEHRTPDLEQRLAAMRKLQSRGWMVGVRFDPVIDYEQFEAGYRSFFEHTFTSLDTALLHSATIGAFRLPKPFYERMSRLYPNEPLFAVSLHASGKVVGYRPERQRQMLDYCVDVIGRYLPEQRIHVCQSDL
jgi:spore photoproduct lyase